MDSGMSQRKSLRSVVVGATARSLAGFGLSLGLAGGATADPSADEIRLAQAQNVQLNGGPLGAAAAHGGLARATRPPATRPAQALDCLIEAGRSADVAASSAGTLDQVLVERGQSVRKGQLLALLTTQVERANVEASRQRSTSQGEVAAARSAVDLARTRLEKVDSLFQLGYGSVQELDQARGEADIARHRLEQAMENRQIARQELQVAERQLQAREVRSPFDGVVADRLLEPGERVDGRPLFRLLGLDQLRVEVVAPARLFGGFQVGNEVPVQPDILNAPSYQARVVQVDRFIDAASATFRMRLALPNQDHAVPAGVRCKVALEAPEKR